MKQVLLATTVITTMLAAPAQAHTGHEIEEWLEEWQDRPYQKGFVMTVEYLDERQEMVANHQWYFNPPPPAPSSSGGSSSSGSSTSVNRGMGSNVEQWRELVGAHFSNVDRALCIMGHESGGNPNARNPSSGAAGLFQVMPFWWDHFGGDRYDPETNVRVAAAILDQQGWSAWSPWNRGLCREH